MWNEEQAALIPAQLGPTAVDSEHVTDDFERRTKSGSSAKVLCKYWSKTFCDMSINLFIYGDRYIWIGLAYVTHLAYFSYSHIVLVDVFYKRQPAFIKFLSCSKRNRILLISTLFT